MAVDVSGLPDCGTADCFFPLRLRSGSECSGSPDCSALPALLARDGRGWLALWLGRQLPELLGHTVILSECGKADGPAIASGIICPG